MVMLW